MVIYEAVIVMNAKSGPSLVCYCTLALALPPPLPPYDSLRRWDVTRILEAIRKVAWVPVVKKIQARLALES